MKFIYLCTIVGALLGTAAAYTQAALGEPSPPPPQSTSQAGAPSAKMPHFLAKFDAQFRAADRDGDGLLTREEARNAGMQRIVDDFDKLDANHDGKVSREEIRSMIRVRLSS